MDIRKVQEETFPVKNGYGFVMDALYDENAEVIPRHIEVNYIIEMI